MTNYFGIDINDSIQWIKILGDTQKPILLTLHGGPGTPSMTLFQKYNKALLDKFCIVLWDQRGTGRSYHKDLEDEKMTLSQIVLDAHEVTIYLKNKYTKEKIFLLGHSFGATLGLQLAKKYPEDYHAYIGVSQFINATLNEELSYNALIKMAKSAKDKKSLRALEDQGQPIDGFYNGGLKSTVKVKQIVSKYKGDIKDGTSQLALLFSLLFSKEYGYSRFFNTVKGIQYSLSTIGYSLRGVAYDESIKDLEIPVYFMSGKFDMLTPQSIVKDYYDNLKAPRKALYEFEESAHSPLWEERDKFHRIMFEIIENFNS